MPAAYLDILQIPAFLVRQTYLLVAAPPTPPTPIKTIIESFTIRGHSLANTATVEGQNDKGTLVILK